MNLPTQLLPLRDCDNSILFLPPLFFTEFALWYPCLKRFETDLNRLSIATWTHSTTSFLILCLSVLLPHTSLSLSLAQAGHLTICPCHWV
jgi:hypothetical protein